MRRAPVAAILAVAFGAVSAAPAPARAPDPFKCAADNSWCVGAFIKHDRRFLDISGFDMKGRYRVCVSPPRARERCKAFTLTPNGGGAHASSIAFTKHFPHARRGTYAARWVYDGKQVGPVLRFKHPV